MLQWLPTITAVALIPALLRAQGVRSLTPAERARFDSVQLAWDSARFAELARVQEATGLVPLARQSLPSGSRELRLAILNGAIPEEFVRLLAVDGAVTGEIVFFWKHEDEWRPSPQNPEPPHVYITRAFSCGTIEQHGGIEFCRVRSSAAPPWPRILARAESLNVWELPDQRQLADPGGAVADGSGLLVEARRGAHYRRYVYDAPYVPSRLTYREYQQADSLMSLVLGLPPSATE